MKNLLLFFLFLPITALAQIDSTFINIEENIIEEIENLEIEDDNDFFEELSEFYDTSEKINLNDLTPETAFSIYSFVSNFSLHYLRNRSTLDIGVLGYISIV